jgi:uncharacterized repeat protein (TIGR04076 family)
MENGHNVSIKVISQTGSCLEGHKVGDEWIMKGNRTPGGICYSAFISMCADIRVLRYGGSFPWRESDPDMGRVACPDAENPVVFELRRLRED